MITSVYLDNNATTRIAPEVALAMQPFLSDNYFNPGSPYAAGQSVKAAVEEARETVAAFLGAASVREIVFTGSATESINMAVRGVVQAVPGRRRIVTTAVEHPAVREVCRETARKGCEVVVLGVDRFGNLDLDEYVRALRDDTLLVTIMHANNETGVVFPVERLAALAKEADARILFHCDATQSLAKLPIDMGGNFRNVDLLSFSGHKFHAPKGVLSFYTSFLYFSASGPNIFQATAKS